MEIDFEMDYNTDELRDGLAENYAEQIEQGAFDCPAEGCESETFDAEVWTTDAGGFEGAAVCRACNARINLHLEDSQAKEEIRKVEKEIENIF